MIVVAAVLRKIFEKLQRGLDDGLAGIGGAGQAFNRGMDVEQRAVGEFHHLREAAFRAARLVETELGDVEGAIGRYAKILARAPKHPGARDALYAIAEIGERHALRIAVLSLVDTLSFGLCADPTLLPDVTQLAVAIEEEAAALCAIPATT